jgi:hypothetical protein
VVVRWDSRGIEPAEVHVAERSRPERLFAAAAAGEQAAPWIESHVPYRFRLYAGTRREALMAEIEVTYRT